MQTSGTRTLQTRLSYQTALNGYRSRRGLARYNWATWTIVVATLLMWAFTAYQAARGTGVQSFSAILAVIQRDAVTVQDRDNNALSAVLLRYGAKDNQLILHGEYWRFITPIFLHVNAIHVGLNMLNLALLGITLEQLLGHLRFILVYLITGTVSIIASFYFSPMVISVGASGAIFGLVGAYAIFVILHRRAFRWGGLGSILWIVFIIGLNLSIGLIIPNVDNYAHIGGLISGCLLGWGFAPLYRYSSEMQTLIDGHSLVRRWPLALLTIAGTLILAIIALYLTGG